ncbi:membrane protein insertion efficiency factor YidD [bacterium AH-315-O15]|nr:membrane protein insertion efficiency factor YidD [bacterium AH-315-O15]
MRPSPTSKLITAPPANAVAAIDPPPRRSGLGAVVILWLLRSYKILISPLFTGCCRFYPSCADYMSEAVEAHGAWRGAWLGARRVLRCHPFGRHGVDPVPH